MDFTEKKLNQILNLLNLIYGRIHREMQYTERSNYFWIIWGWCKDYKLIFFKRKKLSKRESKNKREKITEFYLSDNENKTKFCTSLKRSANMSVLFK